MVMGLEVDWLTSWNGCRGVFSRDIGTMETLEGRDYSRCYGKH